MALPISSSKAPVAPLTTTAPTAATVASTKAPATASTSSALKTSAPVLPSTWTEDAFDATVKGGPGGGGNTGQVGGGDVF